MKYMKQQQVIGKGQDGRQTSEMCPIGSMRNHPERGHPVELAEAAHVIAGDQQILPGAAVAPGRSETDMAVGLRLSRVCGINYRT